MTFINVLSIWLKSKDISIFFHICMLYRTELKNYNFQPIFGIKKIPLFIPSSSPVEISRVIELLTLIIRTNLTPISSCILKSRYVVSASLTQWCFFQYDICSASFVTVSKMNFITSTLFDNQFIIDHSKMRPAWTEGVNGSTMNFLFQCQWIL